jgi:hypothetical protein
LFAKDICATTAPPNIEIEPGHFAECHFAHDIFEGKLVEPALPIAALEAVVPFVSET